MTKSVRIPTLRLGALVLALGLSACEASKPADGPSMEAAAEAASPAPVTADMIATPASQPAEPAPVEAASEPKAVAASTAPAKAPPTVQAAAPSAPTPLPVKAVVQPGVLPQGAGRNVAQRLCGTCHSLILVTASGRTEAEWDSIVTRMESNGMQASADDVNTVIDYLSKALPPR